MNGLVPRLRNSESNAPLLCRVLTACVMFSSPENRIPNPMQMFPIVLEFLTFIPMIMMMPMIRAIGARLDGLKI